MEVSLKATVRAGVEVSIGVSVGATVSVSVGSRVSVGSKVCVMISMGLAHLVRIMVESKIQNV